MADELDPNIIDAIVKLAGDRVGAGLWVDVRTGELDKGTTITVYEKARFSAIGLVSRKVFGAALGYQISKIGPVEASVFAGAAHPFEGLLKVGWKPVAGLSIKF